ncbi:MAG TPA: Ig-like domain-containing protein [Opitutaceae bacterium]|nr:Ig-like domain-containing protein [Opitutaceae bacterium]
MQKTAALPRAWKSIPSSETTVTFPSDSTPFISGLTPILSNRVIRVSRLWLWILFTFASGSLTLSHAADVSLSWSDNSNNEKGFIIERQILLGLFLPIATVGANVTTYVDRGLLASTKYTYRVLAYNNFGKSVYSGSATITTPATGSSAAPAPTIGTIANLITTAEGFAGTVFTVGDSTLSADKLSVSVSSSNSTLLPQSNIYLSGTGASKTLIVLASPNAVGTATLTVSVSNGITTSKSTLTVTMPGDGSSPPPPVNTAPTVTTPASLTILPGKSGTTTFEVGDKEFNPEDLSVTATSSNTTLIPNSSLQITGVGGAYKIVVTAPPDKSGSSTITLSVRDDSLTTQKTFVVTVPANTAPTLSTLSSVTTSATRTASTSFTIGDKESDLNQLVVTATSSNSTLLPNSSLKLTGTGASRTLSFTAPGTAAGTAAVTVTVSDGYLKTAKSFTVTVPTPPAPVNTAPTLATIPNLATSAQGSLSTTLTLGDKETDLSQLTVSVSSSNTALIPATAIKLTGTGASRTLALTSTPNISGVSTLTVTVSDGKLSTQKSFTVTVPPSDQAPKISAMPNLTTREGAAIATVFTVSDDKTPVNSLTVAASSSNPSLVPSSQLYFSDAAATRMLMIVPASRQTGTAIITVTVSDGTLLTQTSFVLTVIK